MIRSLKADWGLVCLCMKSSIQAYKPGFFFFAKKINFFYFRGTRSGPGTPTRRPIQQFYLVVIFDGPHFLVGTSV